MWIEDWRTHYYVGKNPKQIFSLKKFILFTFSFKLFFKFILKILFWLVINFGQCPIKTKENVSIFEQCLIDFYCHWTTTVEGSHEPYLSPIWVGARGLGLLRNLIPKYQSCEEGEWGSLLSFLGETAQGSLVPSILRN